MGREMPEKLNARNAAKTVEAVADTDPPEGSAAADDSLERAIDRLSLEQALRGFEVANSRVIDLTRRLVASEKQVVALQRDVDTARQALVGLQAEHNAMRASAAFRIADKLWTLRNL